MKKPLYKDIEKIILLKTKGCEACNIMDNILTQFCKDFNIQLDIYADIFEIPDNIKNNFAINDYPFTIVYMKNNDNLYFIGTKSRNNIYKMILKEISVN